MKITDVLDFFDGNDAELIRTLRLKGHGVVWNWRKRNKELLPELYARRLDGMKRGKKRLRFDPKAYELGG